MRATLFTLPGSHPSVAARLMLEAKGIDFRRRDLFPAIHKLILRAMGFPGVTVPALRLEGQRVQTTHDIARHLDELVPEPPLVPRDADPRARVEEAERWADGDLQSVPRRLAWWAMRRDRSSAGSFLEGARLGIPTPIAARTAGPVIWASSRLNHATDDAVRADLAALPGMIDRVDELIRDGTIGGPQPNVADYQVATSVRLLLCFDDLRPLLEGRPAADLAERVVPEFPGHLPKAFPAEWVPSNR